MTIKRVSADPISRSVQFFTHGVRVFMHGHWSSIKSVLVQTYLLSNSELVSSPRAALGTRGYAYVYC